LDYGLVEQTNITKKKLYLIVCSVNIRKLGSNFVKKILESNVLEIQRTNRLKLDQSFHPKPKKFENQEYRFFLKSRTRQH
jgi:hypothetical protein